MPHSPLCLAVLLGSLLACTPNGNGVASLSGGAFGAAELLDIQEAVFRYQFEDNASAKQSSVEYYFISVGTEAGLPPELLARFQGHTPCVAPASEATASASDGVRHTADGGSGLIFRVGEIRRLDSTTLEVDGGYYEAGLSASGNTYTLERSGAKWRVTKNRMHWIS